MSVSSLSVTSIILTLCVIYVNGLTDAPNSVATCISTRTLRPSFALPLSAIFNFLGVIVTCRVNTSVLNTIINMVSLSDDSHKNSVALCATLFTIVLWATVAWYFGIPTSESHALIASLSGSAIALNGSLEGINPQEWLKAIYGLFLSCGVGLIGGLLVCKAVLFVFKNRNRQKANNIFTLWQIIASALLSFMHGAQDGQKFIALIMMCLNNSPIKSNINNYIIIICSVFMALGTLTGGKRIIKSVGADMLKVEKFQGFSADLAASVSLLISTFLGYPVSTTHAKTTAVMGTGLAKNKSRINFDKIKEIALTWLLTFPGCCILGFGITKLFLKIF